MKSFPALSFNDLKNLSQSELLKLVIEADWAVYVKDRIPFGSVQWDRTSNILNNGVLLLNEASKAEYAKYDEDPYQYKLGLSELEVQFRDTSDMSPEDAHWFWEGFNQRDHE